jgi:hypothetical protein
MITRRQLTPAAADCCLALPDSLGELQATYGRPILHSNLVLRARSGGALSLGRQTTRHPSNIYIEVGS